MGFFMRKIIEWIGIDDNAQIPARVKMRVFDKYNGCCYLSGRKIYPGDKWQIEHIVAICNGGQNIESNLAPVLVAPHKIKTKSDRKLKARNDKIRKRHLGIKKPSRFPFSRDSKFRKKLTGEVVPR